MNTTENVLAELEKLRLEHYECQGDCWFSCPLSGECCDENTNRVCNCGASKHNELLDRIIKELGNL